MLLNIDNFGIWTSKKSSILKINKPQITLNKKPINRTTLPSINTMSIIKKDIDTCPQKRTKWINEKKNLKDSIKKLMKSIKMRMKAAAA